MATVTGLTAARMLEIEGATVIGGTISGGHLILNKHDGTDIDAGALPAGPAGAPGPPGGMIPGEIRMWSGGTLPLLASWGKWVWADGAIYQNSLYPLAAANIDAAWRTFGGASNPPAGQFRVPDLRGLVPAGLDAMPGGSRANRTTRSVAIILAGKTGEEVHIITIPEMASHNHTITNTLAINDPGHSHKYYGKQYSPAGSVSYNTASAGDTPNFAYNSSTDDTNITLTGGITAATQGSNNAHENMQPTVFVPYIVKLDG
jgi:microcystin-dependent protein